MPAFKLGIDIGGTHTDGVLVDQTGAIVATHKVATTSEVSDGFSTLLRALVSDPKSIVGVFIGTTHAANALLQKEGLCKAGLLRLCGPQPLIVPPAFNWPRSLLQCMFVGARSLPGGCECDGRELAAFDRQACRNAIDALVEAGAESLAVAAAFSPLYDDQELQVAELIREAAGPDFPISLSYKIGGVGFLERENGALVNAALQKTLKAGFQKLTHAAHACGLCCPLFLTQNNGTLLDLKEAMRYPVLTLGAGQTNSFSGAAKLAGVSDAVVVDIGGTSTDIGVVRQGFPRRSLKAAHIAGISLNFAMPDLLSLPLGGGSCIEFVDSELRFTGLSCARALKEKARSFGGDQLTLTDVGLQLNPQLIPQANPERACLKPYQALSLLRRGAADIAQRVADMQGKDPLPTLLVGGAARLFDHNLFERPVVFPDYAEVANAYGAACAEVSGVIDRVISLEQRQTALLALEEEAKVRAVSAGADPARLRLVERQILPYHYTPGNLARVLVMVAGPQTGLRRAL